MMRADTIVLKALCVIMREDGKLLATPGRDELKKQDFARVIGGTVEFGETSEQAIQREMREELGTEIANLSLLKIIENIFTYQGKHGHEVVFLYQGKLVDESLYACEDLVVLDDPMVKIDWIPAAGELKIYPEFDYASLA